MTATLDLDSFVADAMAEMLRSTPSPSITTPTVASPADPVPSTPEVVLKNGFVAMFGVAPTTIKDFPVFQFKDVPSEYAWHIPSVDSAYVVQPEEAARLVAGLLSNDKILMSGPTGSGKSSLVKYVCAKLGAPFIRINMSADIESASLFGQLVVRDGATVWEDGPITEAVKYGAVCLIDEWELMPPEISMGLQNLLEDDGYLYLKEKPGTSEEKTYKPHSNFRIVCAGNTVGQGDDSGSFSGTMVQNSATLDRFTTTIKLSYLDAKHEVSIINNRTGVFKKDANALVKFANLVRNAYQQGSINLTMSPRTLINWAKKWKQHDDLTLAFRISYYDKLRESDKKAVGELFSKVFGKTV